MVFGFCLQMANQNSYCPPATHPSAFCLLFCWNKSMACPRQTGKEGLINAVPTVGHKCCVHWLVVKHLRPLERPPEKVSFPKKKEAREKSMTTCKPSPAKANVYHHIITWNTHRSRPRRWKVLVGTSCLLKTGEGQKRERNRWGCCCFSYWRFLNGFFFKSLNV